MSDLGDGWAIGNCRRFRMIFLLQTVMLILFCAKAMAMSRIEVKANRNELQVKHHKLLVYWQNRFILKAFSIHCVHECI